MAWALLLFLHWLTPSQAPAAARRPAPRLHHLQLVVDDPAAAMNAYAGRNGCVTVILQGFGVGVHCGDAYLLFDRRDPASRSSTIPGRVSISGKGDAARIHATLAVADSSAATAWLRDQVGLATGPALTLVAPGGVRLPDEITHVAIAVADPDSAVARLIANGARVLARGPDATLVAGPGGLAIEVVRDAGTGADAFWCPMHPDVRSPLPGACPICHMTLVPIPAAAFGDYRLHVDVASAADDQARLTLRLSDTAGRPITSLLTVHERVLHLFVVSRDLTFFDHVHPEPRPDGSFTVDVALPKPDAYAVYADFYPAGGTPQLLQDMIVSPTYRGSVFPPDAAPAVDATETKTSGSLRVGLSTPPLRAGREQLLTFTVSDATSGSPVRDLQPYLGAAGHTFALSADLTEAIHSHPTDLGATGPTVIFAMTFPRPGIYKVWVQFQRGDRVLTTPFVVEVK